MKKPGGRKWGNESDVGRSISLGSGKKQCGSTERFIKASGDENLYGSLKRGTRFVNQGIQEVEADSFTPTYFSRRPFFQPTIRPDRYRDAADK